MFPRTLFLLGLAGPLHGALAQQPLRYTLSGTVSDSLNGETLIGATVLLARIPADTTAQQAGASTNEYGFFSLTVAPGTYSVRCAYIGYATRTATVRLDKDVKLDLRLAAGTELKEVSITAKKAGIDLQRAEVGVERMDIKEMEKLPMIFGERDVMKAIQLLPGVKSAGDGNAGFFVRGGSADQNLILLDEAPVYYASHLMGFFSTFNTNAIKDVQLYKGSMPAQYGGRLASVMDVRMKDGDMQRVGVTGNVGLIASNVMVEGPIAKDKASFLIAGRRTYADLFLKLSNDELLKTSKLYFYDLNGKVNIKLGGNDRLFLSGYMGQDRLGMGSNMDIDWGNTTATARWNHLFSPRLFSNTSLIYSHFDYGLQVGVGESGFGIASQLRDLHLTHEFSFYPKAGSQWKFGLSSISHRVTPGRITNSSGTSTTTTTIQDQYAWENAVFASLDQTLGPRWTLNAGLRVSGLSVLGGGDFHTFNEEGVVVGNTLYGKGEFVKTYVHPEPRLAFSFLATEFSSIKASYARTAQYMHLLSNSAGAGFASFTDRWVTSTNNIRPEIGDQVSGGYFRKLKDGAYDLSAEVYYKWMQNQIDYRNGADILTDPFVEGALLYGDGRAYGLELMARKNTGRLTGWVAYTWSRSQRRIDGINNGDWYFARQDRTHEVSVVGTYALNDAWSLSALWTYNSGNAITFPSGKYTVADQVVFSYTERNGGRMPAYHRLDLSATWTRKKHSWNFSLYNAYGRQNAFLVNFQENEHDPTRTTAVQTSLFRWVPSVSYGFKF